MELHPSYVGGVQPGGSARRESLLRCFERLDLDASGFIDLHELRALAKQLTPQQNLDDALDMLKFIDKNKDSKVSEEEFLTVMEALTEPMSEEESEVHLSTLMGASPHEAINQPGYCHPSQCRQWLNEAVVPGLRDGLRALVEAAQESRLSLASGVEWEQGPEVEGAEGVPSSCRAGGDPEEKYLPRAWKPFSPLRFLSNWLLERYPDAGGGGGADGEPQMAALSFEEMSREAKAELAFKYLDRDGSGYLDAHELMVIAGKLRKDQDMVLAQDLLNSMDLDQNGTVELNEYLQFVLQLTEILTDAEFDAAMHKVLGAQHLSLCVTRQDKLRFLFHELDQDRTGFISLDEILTIAKRADPDATPWRIQATLDSLNKSRSQRVDVQAFIDTLTKLTERIATDDGLDALITAVLETRRTGAISTNDPLDEVEPLKLQELCRSLPRQERTLQMPCSDLMDAIAGQGKPLLLVDVRSREESLISALPNALCLPAVHVEDGEHSWILPDLNPLRAKLTDMLMKTGGHPPRVVLYCNTGSTSGPVSSWLSEQMGMPVRMLCGGVLNYYNQGGRVRDPQGREVQAIHPGTAELRHYITRPNNFKG